MKSNQVIVTTVFGSSAERLDVTYSTLARIPGVELHAFVFGSSLPNRRVQGIQYHLVAPDPQYVSVRRNALFQRWTLPDRLDAEYALVVDANDVICIRPLPPFEQLLRGASLAAVPELTKPVAVEGVGFTSTYLNAGVTFWHLPSSQKMRAEIVERGRRQYRSPFDDQAALNEVMLTKYFEHITILPSQFNWRAAYMKTRRHWQHYFQAWWRVDSLDGVYLYHNADYVPEVLSSLAKASPRPYAELPELAADQHPISGWSLFKRRILLRLRQTFARSA